jgi:outer membrane protein assembly factor BamE (lipoprotein component of BamABCDE complex)
MKFLTGIAIFSVLLSGCFAKAGQNSGVQYGMSKQEVVAVMGAPVNVSTR